MNDRQKTNHIRISLEKKFSDARRYVKATEVGLSTGGRQRRLDVVVIDCFESNRFLVEGIEIKVSIGDLNAELNDPDKHGVFFDNLDKYSIAIPSDMKIDLKKIPGDWGVYKVKDDGTVRAARSPKCMHDPVNEKLDRGFIASFLRRAFREKPTDYEIQQARELGKDIGKAEVKSELINKETELARLKNDYKELEDLREACGGFGLRNVRENVEFYNAIRHIKGDTRILKSELESSINWNSKLLETLKTLDELVGED